MRRAKPGAEPGTSEAPAVPRVHVVSLELALGDLRSATEQIVRWSAEPVGRYVCAANVHMVMEAFDDPSFRELVNAAELVVPDGMPLVWAQRLLGHPEANRVFGPDLMESLLGRAAELGTPVGFYGGTPSSLRVFREALLARWPTLRIAVEIAPPFRALTAEEDREYIRQIAGSGARMVFVGIGCPKQERWMAEHRAQLPCVTLGVGQAFDLLSGLKRGPPRWMHRSGLGWLFRLLEEPRRLWRRYAVNNPRFVALFAAQWLRHRGPRVPTRAESPPPRGDNAKIE